MAAIEEAAEGTYSSIEELKNIEKEVDEKVQDTMGKDINIPEFLTQKGAIKDQKIIKASSTKFSRNRSFHTYKKI